MRIITVKMPESYVEAIDELVRLGRYTSRSEVIRAAIRDLIKRELWSSTNRVAEGRGSKGKSIEIIEDF